MRDTDIEPSSFQLTRLAPDDQVAWTSTQAYDAVRHNEGQTFVIRRTGDVVVAGYELLRASHDLEPTWTTFLQDWSASGKAEGAPQYLGNGFQVLVMQERDDGSLLIVGRNRDKANRVIFYVAAKRE